MCPLIHPPVPCQGPGLTEFLIEELDALLMRRCCSHVLIVGDLKHHQEQAAYESLLDVQGLIMSASPPM